MASVFEPTAFEATAFETGSAPNPVFLDAVAAGVANSTQTLTVGKLLTLTTSGVSEVTAGLTGLRVLKRQDGYTVAALLVRSWRLTRPPGSWRIESTPRSWHVKD